MAPGWTAKRNRPKYWRLRATAADGQVVTLGRYETVDEAHADCGKLAEQGRYRDLAVQPIDWPPAAAPGVGVPAWRARKLGSGWRVLSYDIVPFAIWSAAGHLNSYEEAL